MASNDTMSNESVLKEDPLKGNVFKLLGDDANQVEYLISSFVVDKAEKKKKKGGKKPSAVDSDGKKKPHHESKGVDGINGMNGSKKKHEEQEEGRMGRNNGITQSKKHQGGGGRKDGDKQEEEPRAAGWKLIRRPPSCVVVNRVKDGYHHQPKAKAAASTFKDKQGGRSGRRGEVVMSASVQAIYDRAKLKLDQQRRASARGEIAAENPNPPKVPHQQQRVRVQTPPPPPPPLPLNHQQHPTANYQRRTNEPFNRQQRREIYNGNQERPERYDPRRSNSGGDNNHQINDNGHGDAAARAAAYEERFKKMQLEYEAYQQRLKQRQLEHKLMTLKVYEEKLQEERKRRDAKPREKQVRVVTPDKDLESMRVLDKKKQQDGWLHSSHTNTSHDKLKNKKNKALVDTNFIYPQITRGGGGGGKQGGFTSQKPPANGSKNE